MPANRIDPTFGSDPSRIRWAIEDLSDFVGPSGRTSGGGEVLSYLQMVRFRECAKLLVSAYRSGDLVASAPLVEALGQSVEDHDLLLDRVAELRAIIRERASQHVAEVATLAEEMTSLGIERDAYRVGYEYLGTVVKDSRELLEEISFSDHHSPFSTAFDKLDEATKYVPPGISE